MTQTYTALTAHSGEIKCLCWGLDGFGEYLSDYTRPYRDMLCLRYIHKHVEGKRM